MNFFTDRKFAHMRGQLNSEYWQDLIKKAIKKDGALDVWIIKDKFYHGLKKGSLFDKKNIKKNILIFNTECMMILLFDQMIQT